MTKKPNIVLIFPDEFRGDAMGCVGHPAVRTPNIDRLADEGVAFTRCYTNSPLCMPARASLMNGQYVNQHGAWDNGMAADRSGPSHVRNIRDAGYHTAEIGKTHLCLPEPGEPDDHHARALGEWGFDDSHDLPGPMAATLRPSLFTEYLSRKGLLQEHERFLAEWRRLSASEQFRRWDDPPWHLPTEDHLDSYTGRQAVEWIRGYEGDRPFYLQVLFPGPHPPFDSPREYRALYDQDGLPLGITAEPGSPVPPYVTANRRRAKLNGMSHQQNRTMRAAYYGKITLIDAWIGEICKALAERGVLDNTWIVLTSDHGEMLGDFGLLQKRVFYEGAARVPCVVRPAGGTKGWQSLALVEHLDVTATLLDIAGAAPLAASAGRSLAPKVLGGPGEAAAQAGKEAVFSEVTGYCMVRTERYKLAVDARTMEPLELHDMQDDPLELRNLVAERPLAAVRDHLLDEYLRPFLRGLDREQAQFVHPAFADRVLREQEW